MLKQNVNLSKILFLSSGVFVSSVFSAQIPDAGILLKESEKQVQQPVMNPLIVKEKPDTPKKSGPTVHINQIIVEGSTVFEKLNWNTVLDEFIAQDLDINGLNAVATKVGLYYQQQGYHAFAFLPEQSFKNGLLKVMVAEGRLGDISQNPRFDPNIMPADLIVNMVSKHQHKGEIINTRKLESSVLLANDIPGININATLEAGKNPGESNIVLSGRGERKYALSTSIDNFDSRTTGMNKLSLNGSVSNYFALGESLSVSGQKSLGKDFVRLNYSMPLNSDGITFDISGSWLSYKLLGEFSSTGANGSAKTYGTQLKYPLYRSGTKNLAVMIKYDENFLLSSNDVMGNTSDKKNKIVQLGFNGDLTDGFGGAGYSTCSLMYNYGDVALHNLDEITADRSGPNVEGKFAKINLSASRVQNLISDMYANLALYGQYAFNNLDSSQKFSLGGPSGVRGFPFAEATGDIGGIAQLELIYKIIGGLNGKIFYDYGWIQKDYYSDYAGSSAKKSYSLDSIGLGLDYSQDGWYLGSSFAWRLCENPDASTSGKDSDGTKKVPQIWLMLNKKF